MNMSYSLKHCVPSLLRISDYFNKLKLEFSRFYCDLTDLCRMDFPVLIHWKSPFPILELLGGIFIFILILKGTSVSKQWRTDQTSRFAESDLVLHYLPMSHKKDARLTWVKHLRMTVQESAPLAPIYPAIQVHVPAGHSALAIYMQSESPVQESPTAEIEK